MTRPFAFCSLFAGAVALSTALHAGPQEKPDFPPFASLSEGLTEVATTADGSHGFYRLWKNDKDGRLLAELPSGHEKQLVLIATTVGGGDEEAGVMGGSIYAHWKRMGKRLALVEPDYLVRSTGDSQSKASVKELFTERVILDVPIAAMGPGGGPVVDLHALFVKQHGKFFGATSDGYGPRIVGARTHLARLEKAKSFPKNVEIAYELPAADGRMVTLHYSLLHLESSPGFKPREADNRVGYFNVYYRDLGKVGGEDPYTRYISRWHLEKADPSLKLSPAKQPIVWYIEHSVPIRYRRFVREGIESWNEAFAEIGILDAVEVYQQDATTGAHMDLDPEDARYNFFRWNTSSQGYAIGPSRSDPRTGQIVDADVVWHAGLTNAVMGMLKSLSGEIAVTGMHPETLAWLDEHPEWDPRLRMASSAERARVELERAHLHAGQSADERSLEGLGDPGTQRALLATRALGSQSGACKIGEHMAMNLALFSSVFEAGMLPGLDPEGDVDLLDGLPEEFLGGMIRYISAHEVGHTLGLQHNFAASTIRSLADINSKEAAGQPFIASVMEYAAPNINAEDGEVQGDYATSGVGPYDKWAIAFGYGPADERDEVLARVSEPDHVFLNDISSIGPDPRAQTWDMGADPLNFCESRMRLVRELRGKLTTDLVKDGEPWRKARDRYGALLSNHTMTLVIAARWLGGTYVHWDFKGDPGDRDPLENVEPEKQRRALAFLVENSFRDDAFGLTPELVHKLGVQYYPDSPGYESLLSSDANYEVHDTVAGIQATALSLVMNPTKLRRIYDNEFRTQGDPDALTLAEVFGTVSGAIWSELDETGGTYSATRPLISSLRRNLQREHLERLIDLSQPNDDASASMRTIASLGTHALRVLRRKISGLNVDLDPYSEAHLDDIAERVERALDAVYVVSDR